MNTLIIGVAAGLCIGGVGTFAAIELSGDDPTPTPVLLPIDPPASAEARPHKDSETGAPEGLSAGEVDRMLADLRHTLEAQHARELSALQVQIDSERKAKLKAQSDLTGAREALADAGSAVEGNPILNLSPAQKKAKGVEAVAALKGLLEVEEGQEIDVRAVLAQMEMLKSLGTAAYQEFIEAYQLVARDGNPWARGNNNKLKLTASEYDQLFSNEMIGFVMRNANGDVPAEIQQAAMWRMSQRRDFEPAERVEMLSAVLASSDDERTKGTAVMQLGQVEGDAAVAPLASALKDPTLSDWARNQGFYSLAENDSPAARAELDRLAADPDEKISAAATQAIERRDQRQAVEQVRKAIPVKGYLVERVFPNSAASNAGVKVGDILTRYNGVAIGPEATLQAAKATAQSGTTVIVDLYRGGAYLSVSMAAGQLGVDGDHVQP